MPTKSCLVDNSPVADYDSPFGRCNAEAYFFKCQEDSSPFAANSKSTLVSVNETDC